MMVRSRSARPLRIAGWLQIGLSIVLGMALALTRAVFLAGARDIGTTAEETLAAADHALAGVETVLRANEPRVLEAQKALQGYADFSQAMADNTAQTIPCCVPGAGTPATSAIPSRSWAPWFGESHSAGLRARRSKCRERVCGRQVCK